MQKDAHVHVRLRLLLRTPQQPVRHFRRKPTRPGKSNRNSVGLPGGGNGPRFEVGHTKQNQVSPEAKIN